jgi:hypothetical protein
MKRRRRNAGEFHCVIIGFSRPIAVEELQIRLRRRTVPSCSRANRCGGWTARRTGGWAQNFHLREGGMSVRIVVATVVVLGAFGVGLSGARAESQEDRDACTPDVHEHCGEFIPNRDAIVECLKKKIKVISPACRRVMSRPYNPKNS